MKNKHLFIITLILLPVALISFFKPNEETFFNVAKNDEKKEESDLVVRLKQTASNEIVEIFLEEYIIGVVAAEMPAAFEEEALKAQAIASRSYALNKIDLNKDYDILDNITNQAYITKEEMVVKWNEDFDKYYEKIREAVNDTKGLVLTYDNQVITAYYFAMSNGYTENSELVFGETKPYLKSVASEWDNEELGNYQVIKEFTKTEFCTKLALVCEDLAVEIIEKSSSNRVNSLKVNEQEFAGTNFRKLLELRSTDFNIVINNDKVVITTKGYGHGVGMSQYGANGMAKSGKKYDEILKHYYLGVEIKQITDV